MGELREADGSEPTGVARADATGVVSIPGRYRFVHHGTFGNDRFGVLAERFARWFGTPGFIVGQTLLVALWIALNAAAFSFRWDPYPFILLNLAFSTQAAYAAPLILLAQTRQAERDKLRELEVARHRAAEVQREQAFEDRLAQLLADGREVAEQHRSMLAQNTILTEQIARLTAELHDSVCVAGEPVAQAGGDMSKSLDTKRRDP